MVKKFKILMFELLFLEKFRFLETKIVVLRLKLRVLTFDVKDLIFI